MLLKNDPEPKVFFEGFGDSSLNFELAVWSEEMTFRPRSFKSDLNFAIEKAFRENGIEIPFPQRDIRVRANVGSGFEVQGSEVGAEGGES